MKKETALVSSATPSLRGRGILLSPVTAIFLPLSCGLVGGYLDLLFIVVKKFFWNGLKNYANAHDFPWSVPVGHMALFLVPGLALALVTRLRPRPISLDVASWVFVTLAIWAALLRLPLYGACSLLLAAGLGRQIKASAAAHFQRPRQTRYTFAGLMGLLVLLAALSSGRRAVREFRALAGLPAPPSNARNVILVVWDAVRASNLGLYGHPRNTTPNLARWARKGVRYSLALAPAPWTYPSHTQFLHRPLAVPVDFTVEVYARCSGANPGRASGVARLPHCRVLGEYPLLHLRDKARSRLHSFRGLSADAALALEQDCRGELDPREHPFSRQLLRIEVDPLAVPRAQATSTMLSSTGWVTGGLIVPSSPS